MLVSFAPASRPPSQWDGPVFSLGKTHTDGDHIEDCPCPLGSEHLWLCPVRIYYQPMGSHRTSAATKIAN